MKIGIYGDSYSCYHTKWDMGKKFNKHLGPSWVKIIESTGNEVTNYAEFGSAFLFSYEKFLQNHHKHDLNIFVVSCPTRIYIKALDGIKLFGGTSVDMEYDKVKKLPFYERKNIHLDILTSLKVYVRLYRDMDMDRNIQHALVNNLWNLHYNTIVIPGFDDSISQTNICLNDASRFEMKLIDEEKYNKKDIRYLNCLRKCHFSEENNEVLANLIFDAISKSKKIVEFPLDLIKKPSKSENFYFYVGEHS